MVRGVILVGGPQKRGNFGSLDIPAPLLPLAGVAMIAHQFYALSKVPGLKDVTLYGNYEEFQFQNLIQQRGKQAGLDVTYVNEGNATGTGGILSKEITSLFKDATDIIVMHSDICCDFPLKEFYEYHRERNNPCSVMTIQVSKDQSSFGNFVKDAKTHELIHHAEKPENYVSDLINCGIYIFNKKFAHHFEEALQHKKERVQAYKEKQPFLQLIQQPQDFDENYLSLEKDIITNLAGKQQIYLFQLNTSTNFWNPIKTSSDLLKCNSLYLQHYYNEPNFYNVYKEFILLPNFVLVHNTAQIGPKAKLGPYVVVGAGCKISDGVRITKSIIQAGVQIKSFSYVGNSIVGYNSTIGHWCRIEGTENNQERHRITVLGVGVSVDNEVCVRNSIALANKKISKNCEGEHIL